MISESLKEGPLLVNTQSSAFTLGGRTCGDEEEAQLLSSAEEYGIKPYSKHIAVAMTLNYIIGTGCFGLPYAFTEVGFVLAFCLLTLGGGFAFVAMNYTLESLARAEGVTSAKPGENPRHRLTYRKFDFSKVSEIFAGTPGKVFTQLAIMLYCTGTLWSYSSVFASSMASIFYTYILGSQCNVYGADPEIGCSNAYYGSMVIYAVIVIGLVMMDVSEQSSIQKFLSLYRVIALIVMLVTLTIKVCVDGTAVISERASVIGYFNWAKFGKGLGPTLVAINCHYNMPNVLQPLETKMDAKRVTYFALCFSIVFYIFLATLGAIAFDDTNPLVSLNWDVYTSCGNGWDECESESILYRIIGRTVQMIVLLFPAVNVASAFPMIGVTVADNITMSVPVMWSARLSYRVIVVMCRLVSCVPPLLLATAFKKLDIILSIAGLFGFVLALIIPCFLEYVSMKWCLRRWNVGSEWTSFSVKGISNVHVAVVLLIFGSIVTLVAAGTLLL